MNKKLLLIGAFALVGFMTLTAFGGKTKEQQEAEIVQAVQAKLDAYRTELQQACTDRVMAEAQKRFDEQQAAAAAANANKPSATKKTTKKGGPKVDPLPQGTTPTDPQKTRGGAVQPNDPAAQKDRGGAINQSAPTAPAEQKKRGGATKSGGK